MAGQTVQNAVSSMSEKLFPGISNLVDKNWHATNRQSTFFCDIKSGLVLQMSLHFNTAFSPIWLLVLSASYVSREGLGWLAHVMLAACLVLMAVVEVFRLCSGIAGNQREDARQLSTFWFVTFLVQSPLACVTLLVAASLRDTPSMFTTAVILALMTAELVSAFATLQAQLRHRSLNPPAANQNNK